MRILIIEDETKTAAFLRKGFIENGFEADIAETGDNGLYFAQNVDYDVIILDINLPVIDGWTILDRIRRSGKHTPILLLTAKDEIDDRVRGLELGADDYLIKPFAFIELLARVRTILRRGLTKPNETLTIADLVIDFPRQKVTRSDMMIELTQKEFQLLSLLARRAGEVLTRTAIAEQVWNIYFDAGTNTVDVAVRRLRQKLDDPFEKKLIRTIRGVGYVLEDQ